MQILKKVGVWLCLVFMVSNCAIDGGNNPILIPDVKDEFYIGLEETFNASGRELALKLETIEEDTCLYGVINASIDYDFNTFSIYIDGVETADDCEYGSAPFTSDVNLGTLGNNANQLNINLQNTIFNQGLILRSSEKYELIAEEEKGIIVRTPVLYKVPVNAVWGSVIFEDSAMNFAADTVRTKIRTTGVLADLRDGQYSGFSIVNNKVEVTSTNHLVTVDNYKKDFLFIYTSPWEQLVHQCNNLENENPNIDIYLFDTNGNKYE